MDPLSVAASIAGLVSLAGSLVLLVTAVHGAKDEAQSLIDELKALQTNLDQLSAFLQLRDSQAASFQQHSLLVAQTASLTQNLLDLKQRLDQTSESRARQVIWPLRQKDYQYHMDHIRAFSQLIHFALSIDTSALLSGTTNEIAGKLSKQIQDLQLLEGIPSQITTLSHAMDDQATALEDVLQKNERTALLDWLGNESQEKHHDRIRSTRADGTGHWVLDVPEFIH